ncbi:MAG: DUF5615 family PIN-like protein [Nanoarchaeota archaeon]|mgnify:CR=1 FL=1
MKFLTDENIATSVVFDLRNAEFDVKDIKEEKLQGTSDKAIIELALEESRIIITHDKDFGKHSSPSKKGRCGIILLRLHNQSPYYVSEKLLQFLKSRLLHKLQTNIVIITESQIIFHRE